MDEIEIRVEGAPVVFSTQPPAPYNPLHRPPIRYGNMLLAVLIWLVCTGAVIIYGLSFSPAWAVCASLSWSALYFVLIGKRALIWLVHLYQNKASDATRLKCVFEPSCSEYMILAVNKYGLLRGFVKGVRRLLRCHPPNGGVDYP